MQYSWILFTEALTLVILFSAITTGDCCIPTPDMEIKASTTTSTTRANPTTTTSPTSTTSSTSSTSTTTSTSTSTSTTTTTTTTGPCPKGLPIYYGNCFMGYTISPGAPLTWFEAQMACPMKLPGGALVSIHDANGDQQLATYYSTSMNKKFWMGLMIVGGVPTWADGSPVDYIPSYLPAPLPDGCVMGTVTQNPDLTWRNTWSIIPCTNGIGVWMCEYPA